MLKQLKQVSKIPKAKSGIISIKIRQPFFWADPYLPHLVWMEGYAGQSPNGGHELAIYVIKNKSQIFFSQAQIFPPSCPPLPAPRSPKGFFQNLNVLEKILDNKLSTFGIQNYFLTSKIKELFFFLTCANFAPQLPPFTRSPGPPPWGPKFFWKVSGMQLYPIWPKNQSESPVA